MIKKQVCNVCNCNFEIKTSKKYFVRVEDLIGTHSIYDAYDCPHCGCQMLINRRYPEAIITAKNENKTNR